MPEEGSSRNFCPHCGTPFARRLGACTVCGLSVCERCGDFQHIKGEKKLVHNECLRDIDGHFSMIKFVK